jgi:hypothetical protein
MLKERLVELTQGWDLATDPPIYHSLGSITTPFQVRLFICLFGFFYNYCVYLLFVNLHTQDNDGCLFSLN